MPNGKPGEPSLDGLRQAGADRLTPVQFHYLEVLARRALDQPANVRRILDLKLAQSLAGLQKRLAQAQHAAIDPTVVRSSSPSPRIGPLGLLAHQVAHRASHKAGAQTVGQPLANQELNTVQYFRTTWSRLNTNKQVAKAIDQAPKNAGPINSHGLVLKSLALMRDVSPNYLNRFVSYANSLLVLDQVAGQISPEKPSPARHAAANPTVKKSSPRRTPPRAPRSPPSPAK